MAVAGAAALAGCGGSGGEHRSPAAQVCGRSLQAVASTLHAPARLRVISAARVDIVCRVSSGRTHVVLEAQASTQPWVQYDTEQVHFQQAYAGGPVQDHAELPRNVMGVGDQAFWVPGERQIFTTNGTESRAGSYLTVQISGRTPRHVSALALASAVARAALPVAPHGPRPGS